MNTSAGILIYFRDGNNEKRFVLGKDSKYKCWSDFGGKYEHADTTPTETASREFYEETDGIIMSKHHIAALIEEPSTKALCCSSYKNRSYMMFLVDITDIIPDSIHFLKIRNRFKRFVDMLNSIRDEESMYRFREKNDIEIFSAMDIGRNPDDFRSVFYNSFVNNLEIITNA
jgi:hypothetical protein